MRKIVVVLLLLAGGLSAQTAPSRGNPWMEEGGESVDAMIARFMLEHDVPGMAVAIVQAPYITRATGYGVSDVEKRTLVGTHTMFDVGQMKDAFTAVAVMQLVERGKIALDDVRELLRDARHYPRLERLVAEASGETYEAFVKREQFERIGLRHTAFASDLGQARRETLDAEGKHRRFLREPSLIDPAEPARGSSGTVSSAAIYASASDISLWDIGLAGEILIRDPALRKIVYGPASVGDTTLPLNGAWFFQGHPGLMIVKGSANGFSSFLSRFTKPDELVCVTLLANREGLDLTQLARRIAGAHNARLGPPARAAGMRVQESPWSVSETEQRIADSLRREGLEARASVFESEGDVWVSIADSKDPATRRKIDAALLAAVWGGE